MTNQILYYQNHIHATLLRCPTRIYCIACKLKSCHLACHKNCRLCGDSCTATLSWRWLCYSVEAAPSAWNTPQKDFKESELISFVAFGSLLKDLLYFVLY